MTIRTIRTVVYLAVAMAPAVPLVWLTVAIVVDMLAVEPARVRWASEMLAIELPPIQPTEAP